MSQETFKVGSAAVFTVVFKNASNAIDDPDTITFLWVDPDGVDGSWVFGSDPEVVRTALGTYATALPLDARGNWTGGYQGVSVDPLGVNVIVEETICARAATLVPV